MATSSLGNSLRVLRMDLSYFNIFYHYIYIYIRRPRLRKGEREKEKEFVTQQG